MKIFDHDPTAGRRRVKIGYIEKKRRRKISKFPRPYFSLKDYTFIQKFIESLLTFDKHLTIRLINSSHAHLVYDHKDVVNFFELRVWISENQEQQMNELQISHQDVLAGKRFLLLVDNVWVNSYERMKFLQTLARSGREGSKILLSVHDTKLMDFPDHILLNIFSKLPISAILSLKCVCKSLLEILRNPESVRFLFSTANIVPLLRTYEPRCWPTELYAIDGTTPDELIPNSSMKLFSKFSLPKHTTAHQANNLWIPKFGIVNSCNGLICVCTVPFNNPLYVCNPITGEYITFPEPSLNPDTEDFIIDPDFEGEVSFSGFVLSGFGFSPSTNQYKVMRILELVEESVRIDLVVQVLTLGKDKSWRDIGSLFTYGNIGVFLKRREYILMQNAAYKPSWPVYLNGRIHWICNRKSSTMFIDSFSIEYEEFQEIPPPSHYGLAHKQGIANLRLGVLGGHLYVSDITAHDKYELWVMKEIGDSVCWTKDIVIDTMCLNIWPRGLYRPIKYLDNGDLLMFHPSNALVTYNLTKKKFRYFKIHGINSDFEVIPHVPCLIPMRDIVNLENHEVQILHARDLERKPMDWEEFDEFALVEEGSSAISALYSKIVEGTSSFTEAITTRHWEDLH